MTKQISVTLESPIMTHDGEKSTIVLKEPKAKLFFDHGEPFKSRVTTNEKGETNIDFDFNNPIMGKFLASMSGIDDIVLSGLSASDYLALRVKATYFIMGMIGADPIAA